MMKFGYNYRETYRPGDRVRSRLLGYYCGIPGTVMKRASVSYSRSRHPDYIVRLDTGETIRLSNRNWGIEAIEPEEPDYEPESPEGV